MSAVHEFSDLAVEQRADADPILATYAGVGGRDHLWTDLSPAGHETRRSLADDLRSRARELVVESDVDALAQRVLVDDLTLAIDAHDEGEWRRDLNSIASTFQSIKGVFDLMARDDAGDWDLIARRLETIDAPLTGYRSSLEAGMASGEVVARRQVEQVAAEARASAGSDSLLDGLMVSFAESTASGEGIDLADRLDRAVGHAADAFVGFADWLEQAYLPTARHADAVGLDRYVSEARRFLGTTIDPQATYEWGWDEIERLQRRLVEVAAEVDPDRSVAEVFELLGTDPARAAGSVEEFIAIMQERQETALDQLSGSHFDVPDQIRAIAVKPAPPGGALAPYYTAPSEDFGRPGTVWYPLAGRTIFPLFQEVTTAHHEGFPGHHLQVGVQMTRGDRLSRYHKLLVWLPGSGEGWALYAEHLMGELGYLDRPDYEIGLLTAQLMRAARIVIDIGLHLELDIPPTASFHPSERWNFDLAVEMLERVAHQNHDMAVSEVVRYLGWPGQAISYKVGERAILDLRRVFVDERGGSLKDFHDRVLGAGSIGLDHLGDIVLDG